MSSSRRKEFTVCGRLIGTTTNWDEFATVAMDFEPAENVAIPKCSYLKINFEDGTVTPFDGIVQICPRLDLITALANAKVVKCST